MAFSIQVLKAMTMLRKWGAIAPIELAVPGSRWMLTLFWQFDASMTSPSLLLPASKIVWNSIFDARVASLKGNGVPPALVA
nr:hypothetical protein [Accumulibacter sp.]